MAKRVIAMEGNYPLLYVSGVGAVHFKRWLPNTNFENAENWKNGRLPCHNDHVVFPEEAPPVFVQINMTLVEIVRYMRDVVCYMSDVVCYMSDVVCYMSDVVCYMSDVICYMCDVVCYISDVVCYVSDVVCYMCYVVSLCMLHE